MDSIIPNPSLFTIQAVVFLDNEGKRVYGKYYGKKFQNPQTCEEFEKKLHSSISHESYSVMMIDTYCVIYQIISDLYLFVVGNANENQMFLYNVCSTLQSAMSIVIGKNVDKTILLNNMENLIMLMDETIDSGIVLELDPDVISTRCFYGFEDVQMGDPSFSKLFSSVKDHLVRSLKR